MEAQRGQNKTDEIDGSDIVAEGQQVGSLPLGKPMACIQICDDPGTHGEPAQESDRNGIEAVKAYPEKGREYGADDFYHMLRQVQTDHNA